MDALQEFLKEFKRTSSAIVDSYFVVDSEHNIVDFNRAFTRCCLARSPAA